jgi:hypothetical protein
MFTSRAANFAVWVALVVVIAAWQTCCLIRRPRLPSLGDAVALLSARPAGRAVLAVAWLWLGWHVFVRGAW